MPKIQPNLIFLWKDDNLWGMKELSRRDFLKFSALSLGALSLPDISTETAETISPLADLPLLWTQETPLKVEYLYSWGGRRNIPADWRMVSGVPLDIFTPIRPVHHSNLENFTLETHYPYAWVAPLPHLTGSPAQWEAIVGWGVQDSILVYNGQLVGKQGDLISSYAYAEQRDVYPNKIWNVLTALIGISNFVKNNGPLLPGNNYSMLQMSNLIEDLDVRHIYRNGFLSPGGGVCSVASTLSKSVFIASARGYTEEVERTRHDPIYQYWTPPLEPGITKWNSDATVAYYRRNAQPFDEDNLDYIFKIREDSCPLYI
ncbi:MAG TPA: twin-arginine translocation signal domain-containing protein, partial [Patescibacteria group bacterium]|nr:twin-arginine translocation signal domain-containing protein [Patescibacteria group bacterium]